MYKKENKSLPGIKKKIPRGWAVRWVGNKKLWGVSGRPLSGGLRYTGEIPQFGFRRTRTYSSKNITSSFYYRPSPILSLSKVTLDESKGSWQGEGSSVTALQTIARASVEGVMLATVLAASFWWPPSRQPSLEAHWSAENGAQYWATKPSQQWIALDSGKCDCSRN